MAKLRFVQTRGTGARFEFNKRRGSIVLVERSDGIEVRYVAENAWVSLSSFTCSMCVLTWTPTATA
jgi:hypothetical protein